MRKWLCIALAIMLASILGGVGWLLLRPSGREPIYAGKPESYWLQSLGKGAWQAADSQKLGSDTVPVLVKALERREGVLRSSYLSMWPRLPDWLKGHLTKPTDTALVGRLTATMQLTKMGKAAQPAIPQLIIILRKDHDDLLRSLAATCLETCQSWDPAVISALNASLHDGSPQVRLAAAHALKRLNRKAAAESGVK
jgi:hypothetical protein